MRKNIFSEEREEDNRITLKEFEDKHFPKNSKSYLADMFGVSLSVHSKIYHNDYSSTSPEWCKVRDFIKDNYGYDLIKDRKIEDLKREYEEIIDKKDREISALTKELEVLRKKVRCYEEIDRCVKYLSNVNSNKRLSKRKKER